MAAFDSIVNVEEWISDYYLTTDEEKGESFGKRVGERIKDWKAQDKDTEETTSPWGRLTKQRNELQKLLAVLDTENPATLTSAYEKIEEIFGYSAPVTITKDRSDKLLQFQGTTDKPGSYVLVRAGQIQGPEDVTSQTLFEAPLVNEKPQDWTIATFIGELFLTELPPQLIVVLAGSWALVAERDTWPLGRYLAIDLGVAVERGDTKARGELSRVAASLARENVERSADGTTWWLETLAQAHNHSVSVSGELRNAIKRSIEIIGNDVMDRRRAANLPDQGIDGNELAKQSLRYLYRILFLLFAEASPELEILPTGDNGYDEGYGLSRLRDLILSEPATERAQRGTHLYQSLALLFRYVDQGHDPENPCNPLYDRNAGEDGLTFRNLSADLFKPEATAYIDEVALSNLALYQVLQNLLLTKEKRGSDRGFISYATLGVTELGQVYEGLMSYTGFIATEDLVEVAPHGDPTKGSWVVPEQKVIDNPDYLPADCFVHDQVAASVGGYKEEKRRHRRGSFVFRQSSRDRERSASFYSPPVITSFTVGQAIEELQNTGRIQKADDILTLTICEPAMGSGAFAVEATNQLAELYLKMKQEELAQEIPGDQRTMELQKVKAFIALHQVHGVDLNATAVELAEISLWLDTMTSELKAPWFGLHLRHGNSLIGATRATFGANELKKKDYLSTTPIHHSIKGIQQAIEAHEHDMAPKGRVHHFLVPSNGWGAAADAKDLKDLAPDEIKAMKAWRTKIRKGFSATGLKQLQALSLQVERFWELALVRLQIAEEQIRRDITIFGHPFHPTAKNVTREEIEQKLFTDRNGAYQRLRLVMDAWNALWFWPIAKADELPSIDEWLSTLTDILGTPPKAGKTTTEAFGYDMRWDELDATESIELVTSGCVQLSDILRTHPWLATAQQVARDQSFFHWDLDFAVVMAKGGFDFQVGNPPWVRPDVNVDELLAEHDPWFAVTSKPSQSQIAIRRDKLVENSAVCAVIARGIAEASVTASLLRNVSMYPHLKDQRPDLYRAFIEVTWKQSSKDGIIALIHPGTHLKELDAVSLRKACYMRLKRSWNFINSLGLFEIDRKNEFGVHIYSGQDSETRFLFAAYLYAPSTLLQSLVHDGTGELPKVKTENGNWDLRPHADRVQTITRDTLRVWSSITAPPGVDVLSAPVIFSVNSKIFQVLRKVADSKRVREFHPKVYSGWNETNSRKDGVFESSWQQPSGNQAVILSPRHVGMNCLPFKTPISNSTNRSQWVEVDFEEIGEDYVPPTIYFPVLDLPLFHAKYPKYTHGGVCQDSSNFYRVAYRERNKMSNARTLISSLIPAGQTHVNSINSIVMPSNQQTVLLAALMSSMVVDFLVRSIGNEHIIRATIDALPMIENAKLAEDLRLLCLRLNSLTSSYASLWEEISGTKWTSETPLRNPLARWHAQNEIDAIVALSLGVTLEELLMIYRTQFPVMRRYDLEDLYDAHGRKVQGDVLKAQKKAGLDVELPESDRRWTHPQSGVEYLFEYPFAPLGREADLAACYEKYAALMEK